MFNIVVAAKILFVFFGCLSIMCTIAGLRSKINILEVIMWFFSVFVTAIAAGFIWQ